MKKKFKKLSLSTETLRNLDESNLREAAAGGETNTAPCTLCTAPGSVCTAPCTLCTIQCTSCCH